MRSDASSADLHVVLVRPQGSANVGAVARLCANLGVERLSIVAPQCDLTSAECRMFAHHALPLLQRADVMETLPAAVGTDQWVVGASARQRRAALPCFAPEELNGVGAQRGASRCALVFGNEATGLSDEELQHCHAQVSLETPGSYPSYNLSHAVGIVLYLLRGLRSAQAPDPAPAATHAALLGLYEHGLQTLERFHYFRRTDATRFAPKLWRMLTRLAPNKHDVDTLRGMLTQINLYTHGDKGLPKESEP